MGKGIWGFYTASKCRLKQNDEYSYKIKKYIKDNIKQGCIVKEKIPGIGKCRKAFEYRFLHFYGMQNDKYLFKSKTGYIQSYTFNQLAGDVSKGILKIIKEEN